MQESEFRGSYGYDDECISDNDKPFVQHSSSQKDNTRHLAEQDPFTCSSSMESQNALGTAQLKTPSRKVASRYFRHADSTPKAPAGNRRCGNISTEFTKPTKCPLYARPTDVLLNRGRARPVTPVPYGSRSIESYKTTPMSAPAKYAEKTGRPNLSEDNASKLRPVLTVKQVKGTSKDNPLPHTPCETLTGTRSLLESDLCLQLGLSRDSRIYVSLFGEILSVDLATLTPNPEVIVDLLKTAQSEKANYMIAGAYYRRTGLLEGAKSVVQAMIDECISRGQPESGLKPAFLFLSSCEMDLAKIAITAKSSHSTIAAHNRSAKKWLQKVYGRADPFRDDDKENLPPAFRMTGSTPQREVPKTNPKPSPTGPIHGELKLLKSEMQSLRDRNKNQVQQLEDLRELKRKADDDYYCERNTRRKYQDRIKTLESERDSALKMEKFALEQVKREVAARREEKTRA